MTSTDFELYLECNATLNVTDLGNIGTVNGESYHPKQRQRIGRRLGSTLVDDQPFGFAIGGNIYYRHRLFRDQHRPPWFRPLTFANASAPLQLAPRHLQRVSSREPQPSKSAACRSFRPAALWPSTSTRPTSTISCKPS